MKSFQNKETTIQNGDIKLKYSDLAIACMNHVDPQRGIRGEEMYKNFKVIDKLEKASDLISLEDAEYDILFEKVMNMPWAFQHRDIVQFTTTVKEAT